MTRSRLGRVLIFIAVAVGAPLAPLACAPKKDESPQPSFVVFLVDDLGWTDSAVYGSTFYDTPHIDRLAAEGARFTQFYAASSVCSPTRASLMTGKHPARLQLTNWIGGEQRGLLNPAEYIRALPLDELTVGEAFAQAGYRTGYIGKWHLGAQGHMPDRQGFDFVRAVNEAGQPGSYFFPYEKADFPVTNVPDLGDGREGEYLTDRLTDEAIDFLRANREEPFLLVFSHYAVHTPLESKPELEEKYARRSAALPDPTRPLRAPEGETAVTKGRQDHPVYGGMVESLDESLGRLVGEIERLGLGSTTAILFVSDNGGLSTLLKTRQNIPTSNHPLRSGKGWLYEGGIRIPMIVKWSGRVEPGRVLDTTAATTDIYPTLLAMAGLPALPEQHRDGINLWPLIQGVGEPEERDLFWHFPHYHGSGNTPSSAIRSGDLKLVEWLETDRVELFDLGNDIGESEDLAESRPAERDRLRARLHDWRAEVDARMPFADPAPTDAR